MNNDQTDIALTVDEFCAQRKISRAFFYKLVRNGEGPRLMQLGDLKRISVQAARDFDKAHEIGGQS